MSTGVFLYVSPTVSSEAWLHAWNECLLLAKHFPLHLVARGKRNSDFGPQTVWSRKLTETDDNGEFLHFEGDEQTHKAYGEFRLYRTFGSVKAVPFSIDQDPLSKQSATEETIDEEAFGGHRIAASTEGYPYHYAILAIGMLVESRFPRQAFVFAHNINLQKCIWVRDWANSVLEKPIHLPVCVNPSALWNRLEGLDIPDSLLYEQFLKIFCDHPSQNIRWLLAHSRQRTIRWCAEKLRNQDLRGFFARDDVGHFLEGSGSVETLIELIRERNNISYQDEQIDLKYLIGFLTSHFITFTPDSREVVASFTRVMDESTDALSNFSRMMFKMMGAPKLFNFYIPREELIDIFSAQEPENRESFDEIVRDEEEKAGQELQKLRDQADELLARQKREFTLEEPFAPPENFQQFLANEADYHKNRKQDIEDFIHKKKPLWDDLLTGLLKEELIRISDAPQQLIVLLFSCMTSGNIVIVESAARQIEQMTDAALLRKLVAVAAGSEPHFGYPREAQKILETPELWEIL